MNIKVNDLIEFKNDGKKMMGLVNFVVTYSHTIKYKTVNVRVSEDEEMDILDIDVIHNFGKYSFSEVDTTNTDSKVVVEVNKGIYVSSHDVMTREIKLTSNINYAEKFRDETYPAVNWLTEYTGGQSKTVKIVVVE